MNRVPIRLDDFPNGSRDLYNTKPHSYWLDTAAQAVQSFEDYNIPYLLGVSPKLLRSGDIDWLNNNVKSGKVVMHGFDHYWGWNEDWDQIQSTWSTGGEFRDKTSSQILDLYEESYKILSKVNSFDSRWFIPPFNTYNQALLDALDLTPVKIITSVNTFYWDYDYYKLDYKQFKLVTGIYDISYASIDMVLKKFLEIDSKSQITLHWIFDSMLSGWSKKYELLAYLIMNNL